MLLSFAFRARIIGRYFSQASSYILHLQKPSFPYRKIHLLARSRQELQKPLPDSSSWLCFVKGTGELILQLQDESSWANRN